MYKMLKISTETFSKNYVYNIIDKEKKKLWLINKHRKKIGVKNICDLIDKEMKGKQMKQMNKSGNIKNINQS